MEYNIIINKILRKACLRCNIPRLREMQVGKKYQKIKGFRISDVRSMQHTIRNSLQQGEIPRIKERAELVRDGFLHIFCEPPIKRDPSVFLRHPRTGRKEHLVGWCRASSGQKGDEDIKFLWELNRLCDLDPLLTVSILENDPSFAKVAYSIVQQWQGENPFGYGLNWYSNMEVALRLLRLLFLHGVATGFNVEQDWLLDLIHQHWVHVYSEWRSTRRTMKGGNHLIVELAALAAYECLTGIYGPGCAHLRCECGRQFLEDGGYFEGSLGYHVYVFNVLIFVKWLCNAVRVLSPIPEETLSRSFSFLNHFAASDGSIHGIGDWDDGYVFKPLQGPCRNVSWDLRFSRELSLYRPFNCSERNKTVCFGQSGMAVRKFENGHLLFRAAPVEHGHAHLDMLSIGYMGDNGPVIMDSGTYQYNGSIRTRNYFRSLKAHSTLLPHDLWPVKPLRTFAWTEALHPELTRTHDTLGGKYVCPDNTEVSRKIRFNRQGFSIHDFCSGEKLFTTQFVVYNARVDANRMYIQNKSGDTEIIIRSESVSPEIEDCTVSECYGQKMSAKKVSYHSCGKLDLSVRVVS